MAEDKLEEIEDLNEDFDIWFKDTIYEMDLDVLDQELAAEE